MPGPAARRSLPRLQSALTSIEAFAGPWTPGLLVALFLASSLLILWRLELMSHRGVEGTVLGTLFMPYFSGLGNLIFVFVVLRDKGPAEEVAVNCWTNNITNLCLLLALPALIWGLDLRPKSKARKQQRESKLHRLSLALTLLAMAFFSLMVWVLAQDGSIDRFDGLALVGLFLFWQSFHVFEVLKESTRGAPGWHPLIVLDLVLILAGSWLTLLSVEGIVDSIMAREGGWLGPEQLGLLTGFLMVLPNAVLAFYYAWRGRADVVYSSQAGDGHICIPLCLGLFAIFQPMPLGRDLLDGLLLLAIAALAHLVSVSLFRGLPRPAAAGFLLFYAYAFSTLSGLG